MPTPYVTPATLVSAPTGISWSTIPTFGASAAAQYAEQLNMCWRASAWIDAFCGQTLRATIDTEELIGPGAYRLNVDTNTGVARFVTSRTPVTSVLSAQFSYVGSIPAAWSPIPLNAMFIESPNIMSEFVSLSGASGPYAIRIAPGYVSNWSGRNSQRVQVTYCNGWANCGITQTIAAGGTTFTVDDCTGLMLTNEVTGVPAGVNSWIHDGANTEIVSVLSTSAMTGPGTVTLTTGCVFPHNVTPQQPFILFSRMPQDIQQAAIYHATSQALIRGATATTVQNMPGTSVPSGGGASTAMLTSAQNILRPYKRVI